MTWDRTAIINLREILARLYPTERDARRIVTDAGLEPSLIAFDPKAINNWFAILEEARNRSEKIEAIIEVARADYPDDETLASAAEGAPPPLMSAPEPTDWHGPKSAGQLERIIGTESTLVPISYLEVALLKARSVGKLRRVDGSSGTGFLIGDGRLLTNNHVLPDVATASSAVAMFNYQQTVDGLAAAIDQRRLLPDEFFATSKEDDWSVVGVEGAPEDAWGSLDLEAIPVEVGDRVNIIQHPNGLPKQISYYSNVVVYVGGNRVQYLTDTEPGSSGSPVFDRHWNLVAIHHSGGWIPEPGSPDTTHTYYRNQGITIDAVIAGLRS
jgi:hypothetical protein